MTRARARSTRLRVGAAPLLLLAALVSTAAPAAAATRPSDLRAAAATTDTSSISAVQAALENDPVYVAPDAEGAPLVDAGALRRAIGDAPIVVAVLPTQARAAAPGGSVDALPEAIGGRRAVVVLCGRSLRAGASSSVLPAGRAGELARQAQQSHDGAFDRSNVQGALEDLVSSLRRDISDQGAGGSGSGGGSGSDSGSGLGRGSGGDGAPVWPWVLGGLVLIGGGGAAYVASRRRRRAREERQRLESARAGVTSLYSRLGADVSNLDPGSDPVARQAMADASERYTAAGSLLSRASTPGELAAAGAAAAEGLHAARVTRQRLGLDLGPPIPEPLNTGQRSEQPALDRPQEVQVGNASYQGYPTYAPGAPHYFPGGVVGGGYVPGGWYGSRFWEGALIGGLAGTVLAGGLGGYGGFGWGGLGWGGFGPGYGLGYDSGYESGYDAGLDQGQDANGGDWSGDGGWSGGGDWSDGGGDWSGGGDWGGGDSGGGDWGGGDFGGGDSGGGSW